MTTTELATYGIIALLFCYQVFFQRHALRYVATHPKRLLALVAVLFLAGPQYLLYFLPFYGLYFFLYEYKAAQAAADTPRSKIASAAQGYVEINGKGVRLQALMAPYSGSPCLWYSASKFKTNGSFNRVLQNRSKWKLLEKLSSKAPFLISDGKAACYVDPAGAQVSALECREWHEGDQYFQETLFVADKPVYVLGSFRTASAADSAAELRQKMGLLIGKWKQDKANFLERFDHDGDGTISLAELEEVTRAARETLQVQGIPQGPTSTISKPEDGRPFIISHHSQQELITAHKRHSYFYLVLIVAGMLLLGRQYLRTEENAEPTYPAGWPPLQAAVAGLCPELLGTYSTRSDASALGETTLADGIDLHNTIFGSVLRPTQAPALQKYFRAWDTLSVLPGKSLNYLHVMAERSAATMAAFETQLQAEDPDMHARYLNMRDPQTRRAREYYLVERSAGTINPAQFSDEQFENAIDDEYLGQRRHAEFDKSSVAMNCGRGWAVRTLQTDHPQHRWIYVGVSRDVAGNLVAKEYYSERSADESAGRVITTDEVLRWTRWPRVD